MMRMFEWPVRPGDVLAYNGFLSRKSVAVFVVYVSEPHDGYQSFNALDSIDGGVRKWSSFDRDATGVNAFLTLSRIGQ